MAAVVKSENENVRSAFPKSSNQNEAIQIVDFKSGSKPALNAGAVQEIITEDLPTVVVTIGGVARSGKSFLLNLFVSILDYIEENGSMNGWLKSNQPVQGVNWAKSKTAVTHGIWMWSKQFVISFKGDQKIAVLLIDSQGTGDNRNSDVKLDTLIMYICLHISSCQLININGYLQSRDLTSLELCTDYADIEDYSATQENAGSGHLFDKLIILLRNCQDGDAFGEDSQRFNEIRADCTNAEIKKAVEGIEKAFKHITAFTFPYPGNEVAGGSATQMAWSLQDIPENFLKVVKSLAEELFTSKSTDVDKLLTGNQIIKKFKALKLRLESKDLPEIGSPSDALQETILYQAFTKARKLHVEIVAELEKDLLSYESKAALKEILAESGRLATEVFITEGHQHKYGHSEIWSKYMELFTRECTKRESNAIISYEHAKEVDDLKKANEAVKLKMKKEAEANAEKFGQLKSEAELTKKKLEEVKKSSEKREKASQEMLDEITEQMKTAQEKDRAFYEQESERYRETVRTEQEARNNAEKMYEEKMSYMNETIQRVNFMMERQKNEHQQHINELEKKLEKAITARLNAARAQQEDSQDSDSYCVIL